MKKIMIVAIAIGFLVSGCLPAQATSSPAPSVNLDATAAILAQQTLEAIPSFTIAPSNTPVVVGETSSATPTLDETLTATPEVSATLGSTTPTSTLPAATQATTTPSFTFTATNTSTPAGIPTSTETLHPRFYGTLPPNIPFGRIELVNKSKAEVYISLVATTPDGYTTILEYPVGKTLSIKAPAGKYRYVAWVGGNKLQGSFGLSKSGELRITFYKDRIEIK
jgi:hypothetical protein